MTIIHPISIEIPKNKIETQFIFFYNLGARIKNINQEINTDFFKSRKMEGSKLYKTAFFDNPIPTICALHLHARKELVKKLNIEIGKLVSSPDYEQKPDVSLAETPCTVEAQISEEDRHKVKEIGFAPVEVTLFKNGVLSVTIRVKNNSEITDEDYLRLIANPEEIANIVSSANPVVSELSLTKLICNVMKILEVDIVAYLNQLEITGIPLEDGKEKSIKFICKKESQKDITLSGNIQDKNMSSNDSTIADDGYFHSYLMTTRPIIGTVIDLSDQNNELRYSGNKTEARVVREREMQLAIACARITRQFLYHFNDPEIYLEREIPRRNLYHPGPSIVFIGRRGWSCIVREKDRDKILFQLNVVEIVLFVIQSIIASTIYTRSFIKKVTKDGDKMGLDLLQQFQESNDHKKTFDIVSIKEFTAFISRIKLGLPYQNLEVLLSSHITTHTGISSIRRLKYLTKHDDLILNAKNLVENYNSFFTSIDQYWHAQKAKRDARVYIVTVIGVIATIIVAAEAYSWFFLKN